MFCLYLVSLIKAAFFLQPNLAMGELKKMDNGNHVITGRGCGILTPIKYLDEIPEDLDKHHCSIISKDVKVFKDSAKITGKSRFNFRR